VDLVLLLRPAKAAALAVVAVVRLAVMALPGQPGLAVVLTEARLVPQELVVTATWAVVVEATAAATTAGILIMVEVELDPVVRTVEPEESEARPCGVEVVVEAVALEILALNPLEVLVERVAQ